MLHQAKLSNKDLFWLFWSVVCVCDRRSGALLLKITLHIVSIVTKCGKTFKNNVKNSLLLVFLFHSTVEKLSWIQSNQIMPPFIFQWFVLLLL